MSEATTNRIEALLMAILAVSHGGPNQVEGEADRTTTAFKLLSRGGLKGSEIAQIFGVSEATVSRRLKN